MKFNWFVRGCYLSYTYLAGLKLDVVYKDYSAWAKALKVGRRRLKEILGEDVLVDVPTCTPISYGHIICLGVPVTFPEDSEPGVEPIYNDIDSGIAALKKDVDFSQNELFKHYFGMWQYLQKEFPDEKVSFSGFGWEGPITTAVLLRGTDFYMDILDFPEKAKEFLFLVTNSIIKFVHFIREINSQPVLDAKGSGLADDLSSLIAPSLWDEFVIPYCEMYYNGLTMGVRRIHVENLNPQHLPFLEKVNISHYDPSVSPALSPRIIKERINIPFGWRLSTIQLESMSEKEIQKWVYDMVDEGAELLYHVVEKVSCFKGNIEKVKMFIQTCKEIQVCANK